MGIKLNHPEVTDIELQLVIVKCAQEPIHAPEAIQPHAYMIITDHDFIIRNVSKNLLTFLNKEAHLIFDHPIETLFGKKAVTELRKIADGITLDKLHSTKVSLEIDHKLTSYDATIHQSGELRVIQLEPAGEYHHENIFMSDGIALFGHSF